MEINIWHPMMDGEFIHIVQVTKDGFRQYFTDGKLILTKEVNSDGTIKQS